MGKTFNHLNVGNDLIVTGDVTTGDGGLAGLDP